MIALGICNELFVDWKLDRLCQTVKALGYDGLEIAPFTLAPRIADLSPQQRSLIRRTIEDSGLKLIGLHWILAKTEGLHLTSPDPQVRRRTGEYLIALADATREMGGELMVFGSPKQRDLLPGVSYDQAFEYAIEVFSAIMPALDQVGVNLCLEPLGPSDTNFLQTCAEASRMIAHVNHPRFLLHMDVKAQSAEPNANVPELIREYAPRAGHFHAQDVNLRGPGMGDVDFGPILQALVETGYDRWVSVEVFDYSPGGEETARESITCLRRELDRAYAGR